MPTVLFAAPPNRGRKKEKKKGGIYSQIKSISFFGRLWGKGEEGGDMREVGGLLSKSAEGNKHNCLDCGLQR